MNDLFAGPKPKVLPAQKLSGRVAGVFVVPPGSDVESVGLEALELRLEGVPGDRHFGFTRKAGGREPWYPRGTAISNTRQLSIVAEEELAEVADRLGLSHLKPEWVGASIVVSGVPSFSYLPIGTRLHFPDGAALMVTEPNAPCLKTGRAIAAHCPDRQDVALGFPQHARWLRGVVAVVERPGSAAAGADIDIRIPPQWIYSP